jgi:hypothetical protein
MSTPWRYEPQLRRYRDLRTGRFIGATALTPIRDQYNAQRQDALRQLTGKLSAGTMTVPEWVTAMRGEIKSTYLAQYMAGRGGREQMTPADWGRCGQMLAQQYSYLQRFALDVQAGKLTPAEAEARAALYAASSTQAFERGKAAAWGLRLPAYPGDGSTPCRVRCRCRWKIDRTELHVEARWQLGVAEHCEVCVTRAGEWNPLIFQTA